MDIESPDSVQEDRASPPSLFDDKAFHTALSYLRKCDSTLASGLATYKPPKRPMPQPPFEKLVKIIISQQLSVSAAKSIYERLESQLGSAPTAENIRTITINDLRSAGLSKTKASAVICLSDQTYTPILTPKYSSPAMSEHIYTVLSKIKGVGDWTIQNYLIFCCGCIDIFPKSDGSLQRAISYYYNLDLKNHEAIDNLANRWSPYRSCAALTLWRMIDKVI